MNGNALGSQIATAIAGLTPAQKSDLTAVWTEVAKAIVSHIQTTGVVSTTGTAAAQTGVIV